MVESVDLLVLESLGLERGMVYYGRKCGLVSALKFGTREGYWSTIVDRMDWLMLESLGLERVIGLQW